MGIYNLATTFKKIYKGIVAVGIVANVSGAFVLLTLTVIMNVDVIARGVFHSPFRGVVEVVVFSLVLIVFLQLPDVVRTGRLTRSDGFLSLLDRQKTAFSQKASLWIKRCIDTVSCMFMCLIVWTVWPEFLEAFESCYFFHAPEFGPPLTGDMWVDFQAALERCHYFGTPGILQAPWWPLHLAIVFGTGWSALLFLCSVILTFKTEIRK